MTSCRHDYDVMRTSESSQEHIPNDASMSHEHPKSTRRLAQTGTHSLPPPPPPEGSWNLPRLSPTRSEYETKTTEKIEP